MSDEFDLARILAAIAGELRSRLAAIPDETARFVELEMAAAYQGLRRSGAAVTAGDVLEATVWQRLALESALRIAWLTGDDDLADDGSGNIVIDAGIVRERSRRLRAQDLRQLAGAYRAIKDALGHTADAKKIEKLEREADSVSMNPAPKQIAHLAKNQMQSALYAKHRLASALIHPGALIGTAQAHTHVTERLPEVAMIVALLCRSIAEALEAPRA